MKNKDIERMDRYINGTNIYFYDKNQETIENEFDTYMHTVEKKCIKLKGDSKIIFRNPVIKSGIVLEIFPVLNLAKISKKVYLIQIYMNTIKIISRKSLNPKKISKHTKKYTYLYGINSKQVVVYNDKIAAIENEQYPILDRAFNYLITQILYEAIEDEPFLMDMTSEEERIIKQLKYYISRSYVNYRNFLVDYVSCNKKKIEEKLSKSAGVESLKELEEKIRKSLIK
ncbi:MAG: hypothetical protein J6A15_06185 [Clostridia bacterium]|nr:hypothetical protein [Clostridia bacterium]